MTQKRYNLFVQAERCKECGICIAFCPRKNLKAGEDGRPVLIDPASCSGCRQCEYYCPDFAITVEEEVEEGREGREGREGES